MAPQRDTESISSGEVCRFVFLADSQLGCMATFSGVDDEAVERFARRGMCVRSFPATDSLEWDLERLTDAVAAVRRTAPDFVVMGGDMIDRADHDDQLDAFLSLRERLDDVPVHYVAGNHDACFDTVVPTAESLAWYEATFGASRWSFTRPVGARTATFIAVNSTVLDQPRELPGADDDELDWLEAELGAAAGRGPIVVFSHHPPFIDHPDEPEQYWTLPGPARRRLLDLLATHGVDILLCGHRHRNDVATHEGVEIVTSAAAGFPLGQDPPGYRVVEVTDDGVSHTYYGFDEPDWTGIGGPPVEGC